MVIVGEGPLEDELNSLASSVGISSRVFILPFTSNIKPYYCYADLFVLSSRWEGFGNVIVEAMACHTPVISVNCHGGPSMILDSCRYGILCDNNLISLSTTMSDFFNGRITIDLDLSYKHSLQYTVESITQLYFRGFL